MTNSVKYPVLNQTSICFLWAQNIRLLVCSSTVLNIEETLTDSVHVCLCLSPQKGKKCIRTPRSSRGMRFELSGCRSVRAYRPKFCGTCTDGRCCTPHTTATAEVEFRCPEGDTFRRKMMFIKTCMCHRDCPRENDIFLSTNARHMANDYENDM